MKIEKEEEFIAILSKIKNKDLSLENANFNRFDLMDEDIIELAKVLPGSLVNSLSLSNNEKISTEGARILAQVLPQTQISSLTLIDINLDAEGAKSLAQVLPQTKINSLTLADISLDAEGAKSLAQVLPQTPINHLDLSNNKIEDEGAAVLAQVLPQTRIISLFLIQNKISAAGALSLAQILPQTQISNLCLRSNGIGDAGAQSLAQVLPQTQISCLDLIDNAIGAQGAQSLAGILPQTQISSLNLKYNIIGNAETDILAPVSPQAQISSLNLSGNGIGDAGAQSLAKVLPQTQISSLELSYNNIGVQGTQSLAEALPQTKISELDLTLNRLGTKGVQSLSAVLSQTQIRSLKLGANDIRDAGAQSLAQVLPQTQIVFLDLRGNEIGDGGAQSLTEVLPQTQIRFLTLLGNRISEQGAQSLAEVLPETQISSLELDYNQVGNSGALFLARALPQTKLSSLNLDGNGIEDAGAQSLAEVLPQTQISFLSLERNSIAELGVKSLAKVLPQTQISSLNVGGNSIEDAGAQSLAEVLPQTQISFLDLRGNEIGDVGAQSLAEVLPQTQIRSLSLEGNSIGDAGAQSLAKVLLQTQITRLSLSDNKIGIVGKATLEQAIKLSFNITQVDLDYNDNEVELAHNHCEVNKLLLSKQNDYKSLDDFLYKITNTAIKHINQPRLLDDPSFEKPKRLLVKAAESGSVQALYHLGNLYLQELNDLSQAQEYYSRAEKAGHEISGLCLQILSYADAATHKELRLGELSINFPRRFNANSKTSELEQREENIAFKQETNSLLSKSGISLAALEELQSAKAVMKVYVANDDYEPLDSSHLHFSKGQTIYINDIGDIYENFVEFVKEGLTRCFIPYNRDRQGNKRQDIGRISPQVFFKYIKEKPRDEWSAEDVCNVIIVPLTKPKSGEKSKPYVEMLPGNQRGKPLEGYILSYARATKFKDILDSLNERFKDTNPEEVFIWIDLAGINQHAWMEMKSEHIGRILETNLTQLFTHMSEGRLIHFDKARPTNLTRSWCLVELLSCLKAQEETVARTEICMTSDVQSEVLTLDLMQLLNDLDSSQAQCFNPEDKIAIDAQIRRALTNKRESEISMEVAFSRLNNVVKGWLVSKFLPDFSKVDNLKKLENVAVVNNGAPITAAYDFKTTRKAGDSKESVVAGTSAVSSQSAPSRRSSKFQALLEKFQRRPKNGLN